MKKYVLLSALVLAPVIAQAQQMKPVGQIAGLPQSKLIAVRDRINSAGMGHCDEVVALGSPRQMLTPRDLQINCRNGTRWVFTQGDDENSMRVDRLVW